MKGFKTLVGVLSTIVVTLVTVGANPALASSWSDRMTTQAAKPDDQQAPRGQDIQAPATLDDAQAPRGART